MERLSGLKLLVEREGDGPPAKQGDRVVYNTRLFLNRGDEIPLNDLQAPQVPRERVRVEGGAKLIDHIMLLGRREAIAGVEKALMGMRVGGYRKVRVSPHLAFRDTGIPDLVPPEAVLICEIWLREIIEPS